MPSTIPVPPRRLILAILALVVLALASLGGAVATRVVAARVRSAAAERDLAANWSSLVLEFPAAVRFTRLTLTRRAGGDTVLAADSLAVRVSPISILLLHPRPQGVSLAHARGRLSRSVRVDPDTLEPEPEVRRESGPAAPRVARAADGLIRTLLLPARDLPRLSVRDVLVEVGGQDEDARRVELRSLELTPQRGGVLFEASGAIESDQRVPFEASAEYGADDRLRGEARVWVPGPTGAYPMHLAFSGTVSQNRGAGEVRIDDPSRGRLGRIPFRLSARLARQGPRIAIGLEADSITDDRLHRSLPPPVLGPLLGVATRGSWDWRFGLDLDFSEPDSVTLRADVIPHGLTLDSERTRLRLLGLEQPFVATVHLPHGRLVERDLSEANPHFLPLERMDSLLVHAVLTNEDGGFFRHRGFSIEAMRMAIAHNLRAGAYRRGAGTITMQLARNLYLGHERTLARKGQEVILAWVLEHLTGVSKRRLLEIYLNVIEWGPDVQGADEAARYYFGRGAERLTIDESLFLTIVIPSPSKWRWRFDREGRLRPFARAQMHFIGRAMVAKGWLHPDDLPAADQLEVRIEGPARDVLFPPAPVDTVSGIVAPAPASTPRIP